MRIAASVRKRRREPPTSIKLKPAKKVSKAKMSQELAQKIVRMRNTTKEPPPSIQPQSELAFFQPRMSVERSAI